MEWDISFEVVQLCLNNPSWTKWANIYKERPRQRIPGLPPASLPLPPAPKAAHYGEERNICWGFQARNLGINSSLFIYLQCGLASKLTFLGPCNLTYNNVWLAYIIPKVSTKSDYWINYQVNIWLFSERLHSELNSNCRFRPNLVLQRQCSYFTWQSWSTFLPTQPFCPRMRPHTSLNSR